MNTISLENKQSGLSFTLNKHGRKAIFDMRENPVQMRNAMPRPKEFKEIMILNVQYERLGVSGGITVSAPKRATVTLAKTTE